MYKRQALDAETGTHMSQPAKEVTIEDVVEYEGLKKGQKYKPVSYTHLQRGNGLISTNNNNITVEFKASNLEKELITTDRQELLEILAKQKKQACLLYTSRCV